MRTDGEPPVLPSPKCEERRKYGSTDSAFARQLQESFDNEVAEKEAKERFTCQICFEEWRLENGVSLDCGHLGCRDCISGYLEVKIREKCVSEQELVCPMPKCGCPISEFQVMGVFEGTELWIDSCPPEQSSTGPMPLVSEKSNAPAVKSSSLRLQPNRALWPVHPARSRCASSAKKDTLVSLALRTGNGGRITKKWMMPLKNSCPARVG